MVIFHGYVKSPEGTSWHFMAGHWKSPKCSKCSQGALQWASRAHCWMHSSPKPTSVNSDRGSPGSPGPMDLQRVGQIIQLSGHLMWLNVAKICLKYAKDWWMWPLWPSFFGPVFRRCFLGASPHWSAQIFPTFRPRRGFNFKEPKEAKERSMLSASWSGRATWVWGAWKENRQGVDLRMEQKPHKIWSF